jgi:hypothetical protein
MTGAFNVQGESTAAGTGDSHPSDVSPVSDNIAVADSEPVFLDLARGMGVASVMEKHALPDNLYDYIAYKAFDVGPMKLTLMTGCSDYRAVAREYGIDEARIPDCLLAFADESKLSPIRGRLLDDLHRFPGDVVGIIRRHRIADVGLRRRVMEVAAVLIVRDYVLDKKPGAASSLQPRTSAHDAEPAFARWFLQALPVIRENRSRAET